MINPGIDVAILYAIFHNTSSTYDSLQIVGISFTKVNLFFIINTSIYFPLSNLQVMYLQKQKIKVNWLKVMELTKSKNSFSGNSIFSPLFSKKRAFLHICNPRPTFCHKCCFDKKRKFFFIKTLRMIDNVVVV